MRGFHVEVGVTRLLAGLGAERVRAEVRPYLLRRAQRLGTEVCPENGISVYCVTALASEEKQGHQDQVSRTQGDL